jgi:hypothetical protein
LDFMLPTNKPLSVSRDLRSGIARYNGIIGLPSREVLAR